MRWCFGGAFVDQDLQKVSLAQAFDGFGAHRHPAVRDDHDGVQRKL